MFDKLFSEAARGWWGRRALELGGIVGLLWTFYSNLPPATQAAIGKVFTNEWGDITLGSLAPVAIALWGYIWSFRSTTKDQAVADGKKIDLNKDVPHAKGTLVKEIAITASDKKAATRQPNIFDRLFGK